jgi:hypothetical protein
MPNLCTALEAILKSCDNNTGGIYQAWVIAMDDLDVVTEVTTPPNTSNSYNYSSCCSICKLIRSQKHIKLYRRDCCRFNQWLYFCNTNSKFNVSQTRYGEV